jgi:hypothetical protein
MVQPGTRSQEEGKELLEVKKKDGGKTEVGDFSFTGLYKTETMLKKEVGSDGIPHALFPSLGFQLKIITLFNCIYRFK